MRSRLSISIGNQVVTSGANFLLIIALIRLMSPENFGIWSVALIVMYLYSGYMNALVITQMIVNLPLITSRDKQGYVGNMLLTLLGIGAAFVIMIVVIKNGVGASSKNSILLIPAALMAFLFSTKEFFIKLAYSTSREWNVICINAIISIIQIAGLGLLYYNGIVIEPFSVAWLMCTAYFLAVVVAYVLSRKDISYSSIYCIRKDLKQSSQGSIWASAGVTVTWLQGQSYIYLSAIIIGPVAAGIASASKIFLSPLHMLMPAINQVALPHLAVIINESKDAARRFTNKLLLIYMAIASIYSILLFVFYEWLTGKILNDDYQNIEFLVICWVVATIFQMIRDCASNFLQAMQCFDKITKANFFSSLMSISVGYLAMEYVGQNGIIIGVVIGEIILSLLLWRTINNES